MSSFIRFKFGAKSDDDVILTEMSSLEESEGEGRCWGSSGSIMDDCSGSHEFISNFFYFIPQNRTWAAV